MKRIKKELDYANSSKMKGVSAVLVDEENYFNFNLFIDGPEGSPYEGGVFTVNIDCNDNYPIKCPIIKFKT